MSNPRRRSLSPDELQALVKRRIEFLLQEARHGSPRDHAITFTMRAVSNYMTIDADAQSYRIKKLNKRLSSHALELLKSATSFEIWARGVINEHPVPLAVTWEWICKGGAEVTLEETLNHFRRNTMATIAKCEDAELTKHRLRSSHDPERYARVGVRLIELRSSPIKAFERRDFEIIP